MNNDMKPRDTSCTPWKNPWPADGLETLANCPVCAQSEREILHADLIDNAFQVAPGKWTLWKCAGCGCAYLNPRPNQASIHLAYANYYTHQEVSKKDDYSSLSPLRKLRRRLANGYANWRFGTRSVPSSALGALVISGLPSVKRQLDREYRHMPRPPKNGGALLDVGCGDGSFLRIAQSCGWSVTGLDPDPKAAANAAGQGLTIHQGGIEYFDGGVDLFDIITLNHVIEHVHEPAKVLRICHSLLKPGGQLWLETPNIDSFGLVHFQKHWRGLETPRHLVLFNRQSLEQAIINAGFPGLRDCSRPSACGAMYQASFAMAQGCSPYQAITLPKRLRAQALIAVIAEKLFPARREFLTVMAFKKAI